MDKKLDLEKILENAPKGTKLYSPIFGECELEYSYLDKYYPIRVKTKQGIYTFTSEGLLYKDEPKGECMLFPSRDNRNWSTFTLNKFDIATLKPFDKVLLRDSNTETWRCGFFSHYREEAHFKFCCSSYISYQCIPYNEETKHLVGTDRDCPEYYKTW